MDANKHNRTRRKRRKARIRKRVFGTPERPRLTVFKSNRNIYAQLIDDLAGCTLCEASTQGKSLRDSVANGGNRKAAAEVGRELATRAIDKGVSAVVMDRNGFRYHGRLKALADAARETGLKF